MKKNLLAHLRSLEMQIKDAYKEGKLDAVTYNSMLIEVTAINNIVEVSFIGISKN